MVHEAEQYRKADEKRREEQEIRNKADQQIYTAMRIAADARSIVAPNMIEAVNQAAGMLTASLNNYDTAAAKHGMEELNTALMALSSAFYEAKTRQNGASAPAGYEYTEPSATHEDSFTATTLPESEASVHVDPENQLRDDDTADTDFRDV